MVLGGKLKILGGVNLGKVSQKTLFLDSLKLSKKILSAVFFGQNRIFSAEKIFWKVDLKFSKIVFSKNVYLLYFFGK